MTPTNPQKAKREQELFNAILETAESFANLGEELIKIKRKNIKQPKSKYHK